MPRKFEDLINVIDLETTCWNTKDEQGMEKQDIIEIGIAVFDRRALKVVQQRSIMVVPERSQVSAFCTTLTTIEPDDVTVEAGAVYYPEALSILRSEFRCRNRLWMSYGDFDRKVFERQCTEQQVQYPFGPRHINIKCLLALLYGWDHELGMPAALEGLEMPLVGTHHRGVDDAVNIANMLGRTLSKGTYLSSTGEAK